MKVSVVITISSENGKTLETVDIALEGLGVQPKDKKLPLTKTRNNQSTRRETSMAFTLNSLKARPSKIGPTSQVKSTTPSQTSMALRARTRRINMQILTSTTPALVRLDRISKIKKTLLRVSAGIPKTLTLGSGTRTIVKNSTQARLVNRRMKKTGTGKMACPKMNKPTTKGILKSLRKLGTPQSSTALIS
jgi:hypothetical protein